MTVNAPIIGTNTDAPQAFRLAMLGLFLPASALNARTGVLTTPALVGTGNFTATVSAFNAIVDGTSNALQGSYPVAVDAATTITIGAANTQPRIDLISLQIQDTAYDSSGFSRGQLVVTAGTPSGSPVAPSSPTSSLQLWTVPVAANATSVVFSSATAVYPYTAAAGGIVPVRNAADKPAAPNGSGYRWRLDVAAGGVSQLEWTTDNGVTYTPLAAAPAIQKLGTVTLGSPGAITVNIAGTGFTGLMCTWYARATNSTGGQVGLQFNGDAGTNYGHQDVDGQSTTASAANNRGDQWIWAGYCSGSSDPANAFASGTINIPNALNTNMHKSVNAVAAKSALSGAVTDDAGVYGGIWASTAAVTSVTLIHTIASLAAGSALTVYGLA